MSTHQGVQAIETCAHCSFIGPRAHFRVLGPSSGAQPVVFQKRAPRVQTPQPPPQPQPVQTAPLWQQPPAPHTSSWQPPAQSAPPSSPPPQPLPTMHPQAAAAQIATSGTPTAALSPRVGGQPAPWPGLGADTRTGLPTDKPIEPQKKSSLGLWITVSLLFIAAIGVTGMLGWEKINRRIQQLRADRVAKAAVISKPATPAVRPDPQAEMLKLKVITAALQDEAGRLLATLIDGTTLDQRLGAIADPDSHREEVAAFFEGRAEPLRLIACMPITNPPLVLGEQGRIPTFKVVTNGNRSGALLWLLPDGKGGHLIHWPLFHETHERLMTAFLAEKPAEPRWFHAGLSRRHSFELPEGERDNYDAVDIDGSTDGSGRATAYVAKRTPLDRHLDPRMGWGQFYFSRVLLGWMDIAGQRHLALLECAGAQATKPPAAQEAKDGQK